MDNNKIYEIIEGVQALSSDDQERILMIMRDIKDKGIVKENEK